MKYKPCDLLILWEEPWMSCQCVSTINSIWLLSANMRKSNCTSAFTEAFWYFAHTIQKEWPLQHAKKIFLAKWLLCVSNLAILYGRCILDCSFLYWPLLCGGVGGGGNLISIAYCPFFSFDNVFGGTALHSSGCVIRAWKDDGEKLFAMKYCLWVKRICPVWDLNHGEYGTGRVCFVASKLRI